MTDQELAELARGACELQILPAEHVLHTNGSGHAFTVEAMRRGDDVFALCPDGKSRWLSQAELAKLERFTKDPVARVQASGLLQRQQARTAAARTAAVTARVERLEQACVDADATRKAVAKARFADAKIYLRDHGYKHDAAAVRTYLQFNRVWTDDSPRWR